MKNLPKKLTCLFENTHNSTTPGLSEWYAIFSQLYKRLENDVPDNLYIVVYSKRVVLFDI